MCVTFDCLSVQGYAKTLKVIEGKSTKKGECLIKSTKKGECLIRSDS